MFWPIGAVCLVAFPKAKNRDWTASQGIFHKNTSHRRGCTFSAAVTASQIATRRRLNILVAAVRSAHVSHAQFLLFWCSERKTKIDDRRRSSWTVSRDTRLLKVALENRRRESTDYSSRSTDSVDLLYVIPFLATLRTLTSSFP